MEKLKLHINAVRVNPILLSKRSRVSGISLRESWLKSTGISRKMKSFNLITPRSPSDQIIKNSSIGYERKTQAKKCVRGIVVSKKVNRPKTPCSDINSEDDLSEERILISGSASYVLGKQIGNGAYSIVKEGIKKPDEMRVAVKIYKRSLNNKKTQDTKNEVRILKKLDHKNVVKFYESIETADNLYLVFEFISEQSLCVYLHSKRKERLTEDVVRTIFAQIVAGVSYLHSKDIVHRDIKLDNMLIDSNLKIKLIDFGFATILERQKRLSTFCGTPNYMAPEIVSKKMYYGKPADVWALGIVFFALLTSTFPFYAKEKRDLYRKIIGGKFVVPEYVSKEGKALIEKMLRVDPSKRSSCKEILDSPFLTVVKSVTSLKLRTHRP